MCGIAGILSFRAESLPISVEELLRIREHMATRGPDGAGLWTAEEGLIGLAHRRLAIIDLSASGNQPMHAAAGRYHIVFNGEIYNYRELRAELIEHGVLFVGYSDTEVLLRLYEMHQESMLSRLQGMFAVAIWDAELQSLFLARDPFGIKPLYFSQDAHFFRFASQVRALVAGGGVSVEMDTDAELDYWVWGFVREPRTLYRAVHCLEPGTWMRVDRHGKTSIGRFASLGTLLGGTHDRAGFEEPAPTQPTLGSAALRRIVLESVRQHLVSDVPVGVFLSAGIDSTSLASLAAESCGDLQTLTLGFEEFRGTAQDETVLAAEVAKRLGTQHHTVWIRQSDFEDGLSRFIEEMDQPSVDGLNTWLVSRAAAQVGLKVVLSGIGGDELFGGYPSFKQVPALQRILRPLARLPGIGRGFRRLTAPWMSRWTNDKYAGLAEYGHSLEGAYLLRRAMRMPWQLENGERFEMPHLPAMPNTFSSVSFLECSLYLRNQLLRDADWASMAHSVELRVPFLSLPLVRYLASCWQMGRMYGKADLAATASPPLPASVLSRAKSGFNVPVREWLGGSTRGLRGWQTTVLDAYLRGSHGK